MSLLDNLLLVEGKDDLRVIPELMERAGVNWGPKGSEIVRIHDIGGFSNLPTELPPQLKSSGLKRVGIIVHANTDPTARWNFISSSLVSAKCKVPIEAPREGAVLVAAGSGLRFGVWIMPDNREQGMMESFLLALRSLVNAALFAHVEATVDDATKLGAPFLLLHRDKALLHTWLAWQDPPGRQMHEAIVRRTLDPVGPYATGFIAWFKNLCELPA